MLKISVAIAAGSHDRFVAEAVCSALAQRVDGEIEIVIGDGGSEGGARSGLERIQAAHPEQVRLLRQATPSEPEQSLLATLEACRGEYIAILRPSDIWTSQEKLARQVEFLEAHADCRICCHCVELVSEQGKGLDEVYPEIVESNTFPPASSLLQWDFFDTSAILMRRSAAQRLIASPYSNVLDCWTTLVVGVKRREIAMLPDVLATRRISPETAEPGRLAKLEIRRLKRTLRIADALIDEASTNDRRWLKRARWWIRLALGRHHAALGRLRMQRHDERAAFRHRIAAFAYAGWRAEMPLRQRLSLTVLPYRGLHLAFAKSYYGVVGLFRGIVLGFQVLVFLLRHHVADRQSMAKTAARLRRMGWRGIRHEYSRLRLAFIHRPAVYDRWVRRWDRLSDADRRAIRGHVNHLPQAPLISVVMPVHDPPQRWLRRAIESVRQQLYPRWELCIADDASTEPHVGTVLEEATGKDPRIRFVRLEKRAHISAASNAAIELSRGEYVAMLDHDDELSEHALYLVACEINEHPEADILYSDEDKIDERGRRFNPYFKSDWNPDLMLANNMVCHLAAYRARLIKELGGFREGLEGSQDHDLALRASERTEAGRIRHIPHVLYHWRAVPSSTAVDGQQKEYAFEAGRRAVAEHLRRQGHSADVSLETDKDWANYRVRFAVPEKLPSLSVIIPTKDKVSLLARCVDGLLHETDYEHLEVIIVDNRSTEPETSAYFRSLDSEPRVSVIEFDKPFNYAAINNTAVQSSQAELLCFLNNDIEVIEAGWLREMVSHALRPEMGAVGAKLLFPNDTIQHAGVVVGIGGLAGHVHTKVSRYVRVPFARSQLLQNFSAVTAGCMVLRRAVFDEVGGFDEQAFPIRYNDVDLCLKIRERGYRNVYTPYAELYHHESASVGKDDPKQAIHYERFLREVAALKRRWGHVLAADPYYNPNLSLDRVDYRIAAVPRVRRPWQEWMRQKELRGAGERVEAADRPAAEMAPDLCRGP